jgi:hypothetical protein
MKRTHLGLACASLFLGALAGCGGGGVRPGPAAQRVLLISVDGLHQADLAHCLAAGTCPSLARLAGSGVVYGAARTTTPSDSFPGLLSMLTGGTPKSTGVYYDDSYDRTLYAPGSHCAAGAANGPGIEVVFDETIDVDAGKLFSGGIDPAKLPLAKGAGGACTPVYPHEFLRVNTVFEVVKAAGGRTAWSDKHPAYDLVNGPSGHGVDDLYTPEINSLIAGAGVSNGVDLAGSKALCDGSNSLPPAKVSDFNNCIPAVEAYDDSRVQAIINQIDGRKSDGSAGGGVPTLFGMNFQTVSVSQKLPVGGYLDARGTPRVPLAGAIAHVDAALGRMVAELQARGLLDSTLIIVTAKHGQSPIDRATLAMESGGRGQAAVPDPAGSIAAAGAVTDAPSSFTNPNGGSVYSTNGHLQTDDIGLVWLQDQSKAPAVAARLQADAAKLHADRLPAGTVFASSVSSGAALAALYGDPTSGDPVAAARAPNIVIQPNAGVIYSDSAKKAAEHGGGSMDDTHIALLVSLGGLKAATVADPVSTTQIAPTILQALGLDPAQLQAVQKEGTTALPGLF